MKAFLRGEKNHRDVTKISFSKSELELLHWEDEQEFHYNGEMYDVIEKQVNGDKIVILCIADKKETSLLHEYQKNNKHNPFHLIFVQLITAQFILPGACLLKQPEKMIKKTFIDHSFSLQNPVYPVFPPPPDVC